jgi:2-amino-4-hydroxy-6-hydroxymethyldihydropteridine diphosphokinase
VRLHNREAPLELLRQILDIERAAGRVRLERWGPRTLDLDLLRIDGLFLDLPGLTVPHRELPVRAFALLPLLEVAPAAVDPRSGRPYTELLSTVSGQGVRRLAERLDFGLNSST